MLGIYAEKNFFEKVFRIILKNFLFSQILTVLRCVFSETYRKFRTSVKTPQTHCALCFDPMRLSVFHLYSADGAVVFAYPTADTAFRNGEFFGVVQHAVERFVNESGEERSFHFHSANLFTVFDPR